MTRDAADSAVTLGHTLCFRRQGVSGDSLVYDESPPGVRDAMTRFPKIRKPTHTSDF